MRVRRLLGLATSGCLLLALASSAAPALEATLVSESDDGRRLILDIQVPAPRVLPQEVAGQRFSRFEIPGYRAEGEAGAPELCVGPCMQAASRVTTPRSLGKPPSPTEPTSSAVTKGTNGPPRNPRFGSNS